MIFNVYVRMNNIITGKIERLRALITLAVCTRPNFRRSVAFLRCENLAGDEAKLMLPGISAASRNHVQ